MDILTNLCIIFVVIILFMFILFSRNPYIFVALIVINLIGMVVAFNSPLYLTTGWNTSITYSDSGQVIGATSIPIMESYDTFNYIIRIFYLMGMVTAVMYWTMGEQLKREEKSP